MTWAAAKLRDRIQIRKPVQTANDAGGFDRSYTTLMTIWADVKPVKFGSYLNMAHIRGEQIKNKPTHVVRIRFSSIAALGKEFSSDFSSDFDSIADLHPLKSDFFIFHEKGSSIKGTLMRVHNIENVDERDELIKFVCEAIEEQATGYQS